MLMGFSVGFAQDEPNQDANQSHEMLKTEVKEVYKKWINNDVAYIITKDEKKAFKH